MINLLRRGPIADCDAQGPVRHLMGEAKRQKDVAWVERAGRARRTRRRADAGHIKPEQQRFALRANKRQVRVAGQTALPVAVQARHRQGEQLVDHFVAPAA